MTTILAIDDEPLNLRLIERYLSDTDYMLLTASNGAEGWDLLIQQRDTINVILLDRMMPIMDGMEFLRRIKQDETLAYVPVIMQTAVAEPSHIAEGVRAGVFYYLTKPYDGDVLLAIVQAALQDHATQSSFRAEVKKYQQMLGLVEECRIVLRTLEEAQSMAVFLANCFPDPNRAVLGISELLINAVEHGNLGITYEEKTSLSRLGTWEQDVQRRLTLPEYAHKRVYVDYERRAREIKLTIRDEGAGFLWQQYLEIDPARASDPHGRGIAMSRVISFEEIRYMGNGNEVTAFVRLRSQETIAVSAIEC